MTPQVESILIVEDNPEDCRVIKANIKRTLVEAQIDVVCDVYEAIRVLKQKNYHLIITEHKPPTLDSFHLLLTLKKSEAPVPLIVITGHGDELIAVEAIKRGAYDYFPKEELKNLSLGHVIDTVLERKRLKDELQDSSNKLKEMAIKDGLTNLYNHRYFCEMLEREFRRSRRYQHPLAVLMLDIDFFKSVNDTYGHKAGDQVISTVAQFLNSSVRTVDLVGRYGGDEFAVAMPETTAEQALTLANRVQKMIAAYEFKVPSGGIIHVTTSIGVAGLSHKYTTKDDLISGADWALYEAKKKGRSRVCSDKDVESTEPLVVNCDILNDINTNIHKISSQMKRGYMDQVLGYLSKVYFPDALMRGHSQRVSELSARLSERLGLSEEEVYNIRVAGLLHDIGKVAIDQTVLDKAAALSHEERHLVQKHTVVGAQILQQIKFLENEVPMVLHHHERFDGYGYPARLRGFEIPLGARILSITEAWDTMGSDQPYRKALTIDKRVEEIQKGSGTQFDKILAETFIDMVRQDDAKIGRSI